MGIGAAHAGGRRARAVAGWGGGVGWGGGSGCVAPPAGGAASAAGALRCRWSCGVAGARARAAPVVPRGGGAVPLVGRAGGVRGDRVGRGARQELETRPRGAGGARVCTWVTAAAGGHRDGARCESGGGEVGVGCGQS